MSTHIRIRDRRRGGARSEKVSRNRKTRPKTFGSEDPAKAWAEKNKLKDFKLVNLKFDTSLKKKIRIVP